MMDRPDFSDLDERAFRAVSAAWRFAWSHVGTVAILAAASLALLGLYRHRLRIAAEAGALRGAYEAARVREMRRANDFGQAARPQPTTPDPAPAPAE